MNILPIRDIRGRHAGLVDPRNEAGLAGDDQLIAVGELPNRSLKAAQVSGDQAQQVRGDTERAGWIANGSQ